MRGDWAYARWTARGERSHDGFFEKLKKSGAHAKFGGLWWGEKEDAYLGTMVVVLFFRPPGLQVLAPVELYHGVDGDDVPNIVESKEF